LFTGLVDDVGTIERVERTEAGRELRIASRYDSVVDGESIAVNGACLTVTAIQGRRFRVDVSPETLRRTTLGTLAKDGRVNLERALRVGDRLGGHVVLGHVDGVGKLEKIEPDGDWVLYRFRAPRELASYLVEKGSIAVDGVSLTIFACRAGRFTVALIPHTLARTTLGTRRRGDGVNLEADVLLKHIAKMLETRRRTG